MSRQFHPQYMVYFVKILVILQIIFFSLDFSALNFDGFAVLLSAKLFQRSFFEKVAPLGAVLVPIMP